MPPVLIKICGLSTPETLGAAIRHGVAHVGFVFFARSPRHLEPDQAHALAAIVPAHIGKVAVVVDPDDALLLRITPLVDAIQLHGAETPERAAAISQLTGRAIWKAVPVRTRADLALAARFRGAVSRILYDAKTPDNAALPGGMGLRFDWRLLARGDGAFVHPLPWALSGGLDPDNVAEAIAITGAPLVDVSSGVESAPGVKDIDRIARFCQAVARS